jgi:deaminated glutathione amidase
MDLKEMKIAAIQMISNANVEENLTQAEKLIQQAATQGAQLCVLPENFALMGENADILKIAEPSKNGNLQKFLKNQSLINKIYLIGGSIPLLSDNLDKIYSSCLVFDPNGKQIARYNKIHLFDVQLPEKNESYQESATYEYGEEVVMCNTSFGKLGIGICYDLRFPELFRAMKNITMIAIPAAFTQTTGEAHWEILLRARAIENQVFVIASNQGGKHSNGRETFGHSLIIDPWGKVLSRIEKGQGIAIADCDFNYLHNLRKIFPVLEHRRLYEKAN